jgi:hypothetical protein
MKPVIAALFALCLAGSALSAGEQKLMHCFAFTAVDSAAPADWEAFYKATDELPGKISGLTHVWYGKLRNPMAIFGTDQETGKKLAGAAADEKVTGPVTRRVRQYGACMEFNDEGALKAYADNPVHRAWEKLYQKVHQASSNTFDILGR